MYKYILLIIIIIVIIYIEYSTYYKLRNIKPNKKEVFTEDSVKIPLDIYQTWKTKNLPPKMRQCINRLRKSNPEFTHYLYDDNDCRKFIGTYFTNDVLDAYDTLIPGAYKADLWRYCVLYINGGIYLDIKFYTVHPFKLIEFVDKEYFVKDYKKSGHGIYNAFMVCKKGNDKLRECINHIVYNVKNRYYTSSVLAITGPLLLRQFFSRSEFDNLELYLDDKKSNCNKSINCCPYTYCIYYKGNPILSIYNEYRNITEIGTNNQPSYGKLWDDRKIYLIKNNDSFVIQ